jgi:predicted alpha/beta hydrolase family esterase
VVVLAPDVVGVFTFEPERDAVLVVHSNAEQTCVVALERLEPVAGRHAKAFTLVAAFTKSNLRRTAAHRPFGIFRAALLFVPWKTSSVVASPKD